MNARDHLLEQLQDFLEYKQEEGVQTLEVSPETLAKLQSLTIKKVKPAQSKNTVHATPAAPRKPTTAQPTPPQETPPVVSRTVRITGKTLSEIADQIQTCSACPLHESRRQSVPGAGKSDRPDILFITEAPSATEDEQGTPFTGEAGQLFDKMITAMGYTRDDIFITNIVKCPPPENRIPLPEELDACMPYLKAQIALIQPKIIVGLGKTAVEKILNKPIAITRIRGTWSRYEGIDFMPTLHPAYLLRSPSKKKEAWADLKAVLTRLGKTPPARK